MNAFIAFYRSSVGKKIIMSLSGLFLCLFLIIHVGGNVLLFMDDGGEAFNEYSKFMGSNPIIRTIEVVLFVALIAHVLSGVTVWLLNRRARTTGYEECRLGDNTKFESRLPMLTTGAVVVFFFLLIHLNSFWVPERFPTADHLPPYDRVAGKFSSPLYSGFYLFALIFVAYHVKHGFQSAFQTLGLRHKKYIKLLEATAVLFWFIIPLTFAAMPIYFLLLHYNCIG
jgi:succinate dehydrogenase / fumarate reductase cytochrome b subunit